MDKIKLNAGDPVGSTGYFVLQSGEYEPHDLVSCVRYSDQAIPDAAFQAHFIKYDEHI